MDIKPTRPTLAQEAGAALDQKGSPSSGAQPFMSQFVIRTMAGDLKNHPQSVSGSASGSSISEIPPAPKPPAPAITTQPQPALKPLAATPAAQQPALKMPAQTIAEEPGAPAGLPVIPLTKEPELFFETRPEPPKIPIPAPPAPVEKPLASAQLIPSTPVAPSAPAKISTAPPKIPAGLTFEAPEEKELDVKKILTIGLSSVAVLALIIGGIWFLLKSPAQQPAQISQTPTPSPSQTIAPPAAETPSAIFETDAQKIFLLKDNQEKADLQDALLQMTETEEPVGDFIHLAFKNSRGEFLSLDKVALLIGSDFFDLPTQTSAGNLKKQLNLAQSSFFAYSQSSNKNSDSPFNPSLANLGRLGLTVAASAASADELGRSLKDLEQMMLNGLGILLPSAKNNFPANPVFSDNIHSGVAIRYINLPNSDLSLDYAILNNKLIFATSKESMFAIIDRILSANEQSNQP
ncbi:MAG: hypothetical protein PHT44_01450 [Candidatus Portnoybacteria bacterium]|nr:hypothetical protein [Candidatus Portnoybacteria bacterium]MDD4982740.1 hypothetical protein [Candidatus Portnoybacteria bacterium]